MKIVRDYDDPNFYSTLEYIASLDDRVLSEHVRRQLLDDLSTRLQSRCVVQIVQEHCDELKGVRNLRELKDMKGRLGELKGILPLARLGFWLNDPTGHVTKMDMTPKRLVLDFIATGIVVFVAIWIHIYLFWILAGGLIAWSIKNVMFAFMEEKRLLNEIRDEMESTLLRARMLDYVRECPVCNANKAQEGQGESA